MTIDECKVHYHQTKVILLLPPKTRRFEDMCAFSQKNPTETKIRWLNCRTTLAEKTSINFTCASCACSKALCSHRLLINCSCQWVQLLQYALYPAPHIIILRGWSSNLDQFSTVSRDLNLVMMILLWDNECIYFELQRETKKPSDMGNNVKFSPLCGKKIIALKNERRDPDITIDH